MSLAGRIAGRYPPDAAVPNVFHRAVLATTVPRMWPKRDPQSLAIERALRTAALGRFTPEERAWIERIEARRIRMAAEFTVPGEPGPQALDPRNPDLWAPPFRWSMPRIWARFLMRLVGELRPASSMEMGCGFGISAMYQAAALEIAGGGRFATLDQEPALIEVAQRGFRELGLDQRISMTIGPIGSTLRAAAAAAAPIDYALIDAEHTESATVQNFDGVRPFLAERAVVVVDDIFMDDEMRRAWDVIRARPGNAQTITLRRLGIVVVDGSAR
jgi:predicted O-methyltransferase YrrM